MARSRGQGYGNVGAAVCALRGAGVLRGKGARRGEGARARGAACVGRDAGSPYARRGMQGSCARRGESAGAHKKLACAIFATAPDLHAIDFFPSNRKTVTKFEHAEMQ